MNMKVKVQRAMPNWSRRVLGETILFVLFVFAIVVEWSVGLYRAVVNGLVVAYEDWQGYRVWMRYRKEFVGRYRTDRIVPAPRSD